MAIYLVKSPSGDRLVDAKTKASAINYVMRNSVEAEALTATQLVEYMQEKGLTVEKADSVEASKDEPTTQEVTQHAA